MKYRVTAASKQCIPIHLRAGMGLMLFLYLAAFLFPQGSVPHVHTDKDLHEDDACKKDACHIAIYHPGSEAGCHHKFHFTKAPEECLLCHSIAVRQLPLHIVLPGEFVCAAPSFTPTAIVGKDFAIPIAHNDRGPPFSTCI